MRTSGNYVSRILRQMSRRDAASYSRALLALSVAAATIALTVAILMLAPESPACRRELGVPYRHAVCVAGDPTR